MAEHEPYLVHPHDDGWALSVHCGATVRVVDNKTTAETLGERKAKSVGRPGTVIRNSHGDYQRLVVNHEYWSRGYWKAPDWRGEHHYYPVIVHYSDMVGKWQVLGGEIQSFGTKAEALRQSKQTVRERDAPGTIVRTRNGNYHTFNVRDEYWEGRKW